MRWQSLAAEKLILNGDWGYQLSRNRLTTSILMHQIVEKHALDVERLCG